ncbi:MAG: metal ABC transporter permease [Nitrospirae bacterium]|nr:metal ABC transporter permease [Nitrospirota bacterium]
MLEMMAYGFMQRALLASVLIGILCSAIGVFVVLKGLSFIGAGTAHAAFAGVALAFLLNLNPMGMAVMFGLMTVWITGLLVEKGRMKLDVSIGIFYTSTMAMAILFIGFMKAYNAELYGYLFGSILSVTPFDLAVIAGLGLAVLAAVFLFYKELQFIAFDQEMAEASGIPARNLFFLLISLIALTIVVSLKAVGAVLVYAMILIPAATAYQLTRSMKGMMIISILFGVLSSVSGMFLSFAMDIPSGAAIVLLATAFFFLAVLFSPKRRTSQLPVRTQKS